MLLRYRGRSGDIPGLIAAVRRAATGTILAVVIARRRAAMALETGFVWKVELSMSPKKGRRRVSSYSHAPRNIPS